MEKKLTDEEIVKAYEYCVVQSGNCDGCLYDGFGCPVKGKDVVEAFYRLQDEKQKVIQDYYSERQTCDEQKDIIAKQKAEIERLTKLAELRKKDNEDTCKLLFEAEEDKSRLQKQVEAWKARVREIDEAWEISSSNEEKLQKQVDELTAFKTEAISMSLYGKGRKDGEEVGYRQAVKDTAKEIYSEIGNDDILIIQTQEYGEIEVVPMERLKEIIKCKGVEVE